MKPISYLLPLFASLSTTGCNRSASEIYCEELGKCWDIVSPAGYVSQGRVDECVADVDEYLDTASDAERFEFEVPVEACSDRDDCAFVVCACNRDLIDSQICEPAKKHL